VGKGKKKHAGGTHLPSKDQGVEKGDNMPVILERTTSNKKWGVTETVGIREAQRGTLEPGGIKRVKNWKERKKIARLPRSMSVWKIDLAGG